MGKVRIVKIQSIRTPSYLSLILTLLSTEKAGGSFEGWLNFKFIKDHSEASHYFAQTLYLRKNNAFVYVSNHFCKLRKPVLVERTTAITSGLSGSES